MLLKNLINSTPKNNKKINIKNLSLDSRKVKKGDLFFAIKGHELNGENFINEAERKGALAVVCSTNFKKCKLNIPVIRVKDIRETLALACKKFFKQKPKNIIAVTGTNGKSSVADFYHQILSANNIPVATIGTLGIKKNKKIKIINLTSPNIILLHQELMELKKSKIDNVVIEASSHGLEQKRLNGINLKAGIFTNFSQDHLDYHKTMENYLSSKMILFKKLIKPNQYMITDSEIKEFSKLKNIAHKKKQIILTIDNSSLEEYKKITGLIGSFQIKNLLMSVLAAKICHLSKNQITKSLKKIKSINGRLELMRILPNKAKVFLDYAHTPDALLTTLKSLKEFYKNDLSLVFGCGGERDIKKRASMAKIANKLCSKIYVTDDNPRKENPKKIRDQIKKNLQKKKYTEIGNRKIAIKTAIQNLEPHEILVVAGKGHENYQDYGNKIIKFSDREIIKNIKIKKKQFNQKELNHYHNSNILNKVLKTKNQYNFHGVTIDSKKTKKGNLFIAIKGKNKDGHNYVSEAINKGANYCVVSKKLKNVSSKKLINVNNTTVFLNRLAHKKRTTSKARIVAITGSAGKTSLKTMLGTLLSSFGSTCFSPKSYNNHYGVPISLSNLEFNHSYGVFEVGMSKTGEIKNLSRLVKPDIAIITNVAEAHIENFSNLKDIARAKGEIIDLIKKDGTLVLNRDDNFFEYLNSLATKKKVKVISFGLSKRADISLVNVKKIKNEKIFKIKVINEIYFLKAKNINIYNILSSLAVFKEFNLNIKKIINSFQFLKPLDGRGKVHIINRYRAKFNLIDESYNANPLSVKNAIINLSNIKKSNCKKYLLLGDMLELGNKSDIYHKKISKIINNTDIDKLFVYGNKILNTYKHTKKTKKGNILKYIKNFDEMFSKIIKKNDYLMIKGSNATGLNKLSKKLIKGVNVI